MIYYTASLSCKFLSQKNFSSGLHHQNSSKQWKGFWTPITPTIHAIFINYKSVRSFQWFSVFKIFQLFSGLTPSIVICWSYARPLSSTTVKTEFKIAYHYYKHTSSDCSDLSLLRYTAPLFISVNFELLITCSQIVCVLLTLYTTSKHHLYRSQYTRFSTYLVLFYNILASIKGKHECVYLRWYSISWISCHIYFSLCYIYSRRKLWVYVPIYGRYLWPDFQILEICAYATFFLWKN